MARKKTVRLDKDTIGKIALGQKIKLNDKKNKKILRIY
jgi:hypothetical protein